MVSTEALAVGTACSAAGGARLIFTLLSISFCLWMVYRLNSMTIRLQNVLSRIMFFTMDVLSRTYRFLYKIAWDNKMQFIQVQNGSVI